MAQRTPPRTRTSPQDLDPDISGDLHFVGSACLVAGTLLRSVPGCSQARITEAVVDALTAKPGTETRSVRGLATSAITSMAQQVLCDLASEPDAEVRLARPAVARMARRLASGELAARVGAPFEGPRSDLALEDLITHLTLEGIDAERLCWAVIHRESQRHFRLVKMVANRLAGSFPACTADDLFGWGWNGLRVALRKYDPSLGFAFSTYACVRIQGYMRDGIRSESPIPKRLLTFARKAAQARATLTHELGRAPELEAVAAALGRSPEDLSVLTRLGPPASLEELSEVRRGESAILVDPSDPADDAIDGALRDAVASALDALPEEEATAVRLLVLDGVPMAEATAQAGVGRRLLRTRKDRGLSLLRPMLADWQPEAAPLSDAA